MKSLVGILLLFFLSGGANAEPGNGLDEEVFRIGVSSRTFPAANRNNAQAALKVWADAIIRERNLQMNLAFSDGGYVSALPRPGVIREFKIRSVSQPEKTFTLRLSRPGPDQVLFQVTDNGMGIAPENLTRIFQHGFTTRRDGHGFGLHSGALAANELGGRLDVQSDGPGLGATFSLELPTGRDSIS